MRGLLDAKIHFVFVQGPPGVDGTDNSVTGPKGLPVRVYQLRKPSFCSYFFPKHFPSKTLVQAGHITPKRQPPVFHIERGQLSTNHAIQDVYLVLTHILSVAHTLIQNSPDFRVSHDQPGPGSLLKRVFGRGMQFVHSSLLLLRAKLVSLVHLVMLEVLT